MYGTARFCRLSLALVAVALLAACGAPQQVRAPDAAPGAGHKTAFGSTAKLRPEALRGDIYEVPDATERLPDFAALKSTGAVYAERFDVPRREFTEGFPGVTARFEWFALRFAGTWTPKTAGTWKFRLSSDDGAKLFVDGTLVVDNDGVHAEAWQEGQIELTAAPHSVELQYFQGPATEIALQLFATPPGGSEHIWSIDD